MEALDPTKWHILYLDELPSQMGEDIRKYMLSRRVVVVFIPGGLTDVLQPVDIHVGARIKAIISQLYKAALARHYYEWRDYKSSKALSSEVRRLHMASWVSRAWEYLKVYEKDLIRRSFEKSIFIKRDGTNKLELERVSEKYVPQFWCVSSEILLFTS